MRGRYAPGIRPAGSPVQVIGLGKDMTILPKSPSRGFYLAILLSLAGVVFYILWPLLPFGAPFGYLDAKRDLSEGHLAMNVSMWDRGWQGQWKRNVKEKYNIELKAKTPSSFNPASLASYDGAYNSLQRAEIVKRFGRDVVDEERLILFETRTQYGNSNK